VIAHARGPAASLALTKMLALTQMLALTSRRFHAQTNQPGTSKGSVIGMDKDELLERYEALGEDADFLAAKPMFEAEIRRREESEAGLHGPDATLLLRQYGYLLNCHGRITIRRAIEQYQRAIGLGSDDDQVQYMWIGAKATLSEAEDAIARYRERVAASPGDVRELRFLAYAYLTAHEFDAAESAIDTGLAIAPDDAGLICDRGEVRAHGGDPEGALADWRRAHELDPENFAPVYSSAFLLEREGRLAEAVEAWQRILDDATEHGWELTAAWPRQEIGRLLGLLERREDPSG
jgi:tetratricopeptide (TPR) repeat protein